MKLLEQIKQNSLLKWSCRIIILFLAMLILNDGFTRLSISNDTQVIIGICEIVSIAFFVVCLMKIITNKIDNKLTQEEQKQTKNESKNSN